GIKGSGEQARVTLERKRGEKLLRPLPPGGGIEHRQVRRLRDRGLREADLQHDKEWQQEQCDEPRIGSEDRDPHGPVALRRVLHDQSINRTPASGAQLNHTRSFTWIARAERCSFITATVSMSPSSSRTL